MISLLLTLFISLFSICPSVDRLEDQYEDNVIESSYFVEKKAFTNQQYLYLSSTDLTNPANVLATYNQLCSMSSLPIGNGSYISGSDFESNGGTLVFDTSTFTSAVSCYYGTINELQSWAFIVSSVQFTNVVNNDNSNIDFKITIFGTRNGTPNEFGYRSIQTTTTFSGVSQTSWSSSVYRKYNNNLHDTLYQYWLFNLNIWYDYIRLGQDTYDDGYRDGYSLGFEDGRMDTQATYDEQVYNEGYQEGYAEGLQYATDTGSTASTIFNGIFDVGLLPVNVFLTIFNFEVFGINIAGIVSALLTLSVVIIIVRFLIGGKSDDK